MIIALMDHAGSIMSFNVIHVDNAPSVAYLHYLLTLWHLQPRRIGLFRKCPWRILIRLHLSQPKYPMS
jgi:hypothetical protein